MQIVYAIGDESYRRHITVNGTETLCGQSAGGPVLGALPVNCQECRATNGDLVRQHRPAVRESRRPGRRTSLTLAMSLRLYLDAAQRGSEYYTYPNGPRPVLAPHTDQERGVAAAHAARLAQEWREDYPEDYRRWQEACTAAGDALDPSAYVSR